MPGYHDMLSCTWGQNKWRGLCNNEDETSSHWNTILHKWYIYLIFNHDFILPRNGCIRNSFNISRRRTHLQLLKVFSEEEGVEALSRALFCWGFHSNTRWIYTQVQTTHCKEAIYLLHLFIPGCNWAWLYYECRFTHVKGLLHSV